MKSQVSTLMFDSYFDQQVRTRFAMGTADGKVLTFSVLKEGPSSGSVDQQHEGAVNAIAFSPKDHLCASAGDDQIIKLWPTQAGKELKGHSAAIRALAFSTDGKRLVSGGDDQQIRLWDVETAKEIDHINVQGPVTSLAMTPDGAHCLVSHKKGVSPAAVTRVDLTTRKMTLTISTDGLLPVAVAVPHVGSLGFSVQAGNSPLLVWNRLTGERVGTVGKNVALAAVQGDGLRVLTGDANGALTFWNSETGQSVQELAAASSALTSLAISVNGQYGLSGHADGSVRLRTLTGPADKATVLYSDDPVACIAVAASGDEFLAGDLKRIQSWKTSAPPFDYFRPNGSSHDGGEISCIKYLPDEAGIIYALGGSRNTENVVAINRSKIFGHLSLLIPNKKRDFTEFHGHTDRITSVDCSRERLVSASLDGTVRVWNVGQQNEGETLSIGSPVRAMALSPVSDRLVLVGSNETSLQLWDIPRQERVREFRGMARGIQSVGFSEDGKRVIAGGDDGTVRVWD
ncbi:MAG TPA: hypothetical protein VGH74_03800, partial [Planctomycetaceae bacterium]